MIAEQAPLGFLVAPSVQMPALRGHTLGSGVQTPRLVAKNDPPMNSSVATMGTSMPQRKSSVAGNAVALFVYAALAARRGRKSVRTGRSLHAMGKQERKNTRAGGRLHALAQQEVASVKTDKEKQAEELRLQAASLRESIAELEAEQAEAEKNEQLKLFKTFDMDGSGSISVEELQHGWKEVIGKALDPSMADSLVKEFDANKNGYLEFEEFDMHRLQASFDKLLVHRDIAELARKKAEEKRIAEEEIQQKIKEYNETLPGNDDTGIIARLGSIAAYCLPIWDCARLGLPLALMVQLLSGSSDFLQSLDFFVTTSDAIPFGSLIVYIFLQWLSDREELPALTRYNLKQAALLDIAIAVPAILADASGLIPDQTVGSQIWCVLHSIGFLVLVSCCAYSMVSSALGIAPRAIPVISANAVEGIAGKPPSLEDIEKDSESSA